MTPKTVGTADAVSVEAVDVEKWAGWIAHAFSPNNARFATLLAEICARLGVGVGDAVATTMLEEMMPRLRGLKVGADSLLALTAEDVLAAERSTEEALLRVGKFNDTVADANFGDPSAFFRGLDGLVGHPDVNLFDAVKHEHNQHDDDSNDEFTTPNYGVTTNACKEWALVFERDEAKRRGIVGGGDSLSGGVRHNANNNNNRVVERMADRLWKDLGELRSKAHDLINAARARVGVVQEVSAEDIREIGLLEEEIGCLRLYTG